MDFKKLAQGKTYGVNEMCPKFIYKAMHQKDCEIMFARRDFHDWVVVVTLDFYKDLIEGFKYKVCPCCGSKVYED